MMFVEEMFKMDVIYEGMLLNQATQHKERFKVIKLNSEHLPAVLDVQHQVFDNLKSKKTLQPLTLDEFSHITSGMGMLIGVFVEKKLIAYRALLCPGDHVENLGRDLNLTKEDQMKVVHQEISCVLSDYRGNALQKQMGQLIMSEFEKVNYQYRYLCTTVHPNNLPSLTDKFSQGMFIRQLKEKYEGTIRYILFKDLKANIALDLTTIIAIVNEDIERQQKVLNQGYYGFEVVEQANETFIRFAKTSNY